MKILMLLPLLSIAQIANANQVAQCLGTFVFDHSPVTAKIYFDEGVGLITVETAIDTVQGQAKVDVSPEAVTVSSNNFQMDFSVSRESSSFPVQAFRDGQFFVEDFYCIRVN